MLTNWRTICVGPRRRNWLRGMTAMNVRLWMLGASLGVAALFSAGSAMAVPQISGCTINAGSAPATQTCNFYETDANGNASEISSPVTNQIAGTFWHAGYSEI